MKIKYFLERVLLKQNFKWLKAYILFIRARAGDGATWFFFSCPSSSQKNGSPPVILRV